MPDQRPMLSFSVTGRRDSPQIVFLHGVGISSWMWRTVTVKLPEYRAILVDLPGHGESADIPWISIEETARDVWRAVNECRTSNALHLVGLSLGGYVALHLLIQRPADFASALLTGIHAGDMPRQWLTKGGLKVLTPLARSKTLARATARRMGAGEGEIEGFVSEALKTDRKSYQRAVSQIVEFELPERMEDIGARTLLIAGDQEPPLIRNSLPVIADRIPEATAVQLPGVGQGWSGGNPRLFARMVRDHVEDAEPTGEQVA